MTDEQIVVAALGDSITAGTPRWDPDPTVRVTISCLDERHQWPYWASRVNPRLVFLNHGVNRERTDQIAARLETAATDADALIVQGGINDLVQGRSPETAAANLRSIAQRGLELGLPTALAEVLPWNNGYPAHDRPIRKLNELLHGFAKSAQMPVLPFYSALEDADRPGRMREIWTDDGNHPSLAGHRRLGETALTSHFAGEWARST